MWKLLKLLFFLAVLFSLIACGTYPQYRTYESFRISQIPIERVPNKLTKGFVTIEDKGTIDNIIQPVEVQACEGNILVFKDVQKTRYTQNGPVQYNAKEPVFEIVDPLENVYARRIKIHNMTDHLLYLSQIDILLVDPAGNEHEVANKEFLKNFIQSQRPCRSTHSLLSTLNLLKIIGDSNIRIRPKRDDEFLVTFPNLIINIPGEWRLEFHNFPVETNPAGQIVKTTSFEFPFEVKKYKLTIEKQKDDWMEGWREISRTEEEVFN